VQVYARVLGQVQQQMALFQRDALVTTLSIPSHLLTSQVPPSDHLGRFGWLDQECSGGWGGVGGSAASDRSRSQRWVCPFYETLRVKCPELFRDATNLSSVFSSAQIARFLYDSYLMHV
jgi:hypothetical protein